MVIVGITGGIGSGKSVISKLLVAMGYPVYDSDAEAKKIMQYDLSVIKALQLEFGENTYLNNQLNKQHLAGEVFGNPERLRALNAIVHPAVKRDFQAWAKQQSNPVVFLETAILFESGFNSETHKVILVTAPLDIRIERVVRRDQCTQEQVMQRIAQQWTEEAKALKSDFIIVNDGQHSLIKQTEKIISELTQ
ncbi:dephospho-CoA kinase [Paludibacter jiangxiensis]|uniref:Dephospho-CoA kinase n=1 Tax=Paludibacter jiangxiensis TaxID=681398 RepID=A0A161LEU0_9BACT|nr:dephospho-CoA kinase [Paludibacter jiangxiensis]GAT63295.1 dephospho-CoA kinase [Paludibacter jiangxiensis]